jgi:hypothetical protein
MSAYGIDIFTDYPVSPELLAAAPGILAALGLGGLGSKLLDVFRDVKGRLDENTVPNNDQ